MNRRSFIASGTLGMATLAINPLGANASERNRLRANTPHPWTLCINTGSIKANSLEEKIEIAVRAGFKAIEPWDSELIAYEQKGGNLSTLSRELRDTNISVPIVKGLWNAIPTDETEWQKQYQTSRTRMRTCSSIGCGSMEIIPGYAGNTYIGYGDMEKLAQRYNQLLNWAFNDYGIIPALGHAPYHHIRSVSMATAIAMSSNHIKAAIVPDIFNIYASDGAFNALQLLNPEAIAAIKISDVSAGKARNTLKLEDRLIPGEGLLPIERVLILLRKSGYKGVLSLEFYNPEYQYKNQVELTTAAFGLISDAIANAML